ncbi:protein SRC2 homolog [Malania oleifera]|uniref:protein SRC2 homolog n=1 Tax=Malania oleifera TaxID=397392 RepID=UPI0025ADEA7D|nr:protein SRC2 homolog [Malania oleifera]
MAGRYEAEITVSSGKDLKNVNWRHGDLKPYAVLWINSQDKCSTKVADDGDTYPRWDHKLVIPLLTPIDDSTLYVDVVHAGAAEGTKPLIGSGKLHLVEIVDEGGIGVPVKRSIKLKRPSGRPQGKIEIEVNVRQPYRAPDPYYASPYGVPQPATSRDFSAPYGGQSYGTAPPPAPYGASPYAAPPAGYPYGAPPPGPYGQPAYGQAPPAYGQAPPMYGQDATGTKSGKKHGMGMGTGIAVGAAAGLLGGLALAEGADYVENKIADNAAEKVEDDLGYDYDDDF